MSIEFLSIDDNKIDSSYYSAWEPYEEVVEAIIEEMKKYSKIYENPNAKSILLKSAGIQGSGYWSDTVFPLLAHLGEDKYYVSPIKERWNFGTKRCGWLYDLSWLKCDEGKDWKKAKELVLACELEWSTNKDALLEDYLKIHFSYAKIKLFICEENNFIRSDEFEKFARKCSGLILIVFPKKSGAKKGLKIWLNPPKEKHTIES